MYFLRIKSYKISHAILACHEYLHPCALASRSTAIRKRGVSFRRLYKSHWIKCSLAFVLHEQLLQCSLIFLDTTPSLMTHVFGVLAMFFLALAPRSDFIAGAACMHWPRTTQRCYRWRYTAVLSLVFTCSDAIARAMQRCYRCY